MGGGSWNGGGDLPAHPSAWCKLRQGWVEEVDVADAGTVTFQDVKAGRTVHRLWRDGDAGTRSTSWWRTGSRPATTPCIPGGGLLVWHVDDDQPDNSDENHHLVGLVQADGRRDLERNRNRGDAGDCYPGTSANTELTPTSTPSTRSYAGQDTAVSITQISAAGRDDDGDRVGEPGRVAGRRRPGRPSRPPSPPRARTARSPPPWPTWSPTSSP